MSAPNANSGDGPSVVSASDSRRKEPFVLLPAALCARRCAAGVPFAHGLVRQGGQGLGSPARLGDAARFRSGLLA